MYIHPSDYLWLFCSAYLFLVGTTVLIKGAGSLPRYLSCPGSVALLGISVLWFGVLLDTLDRDTRKIRIAERLGVDLTQYSDTLQFPGHYLAGRLRKGSSDRAEARQILTPTAQVAYVCLKGEIEKYLYLYDSVQDAVVVNVSYDIDGIVESIQVVDSTDHYRLNPQNCAPF
jgi:hypothetical protein